MSLYPSYPRLICFMVCFLSISYSVSCVSSKDVLSSAVNEPMQSFQTSGLSIPAGGVLDLRLKGVSELSARLPPVPSSSVKEDSGVRPSQQLSVGVDFDLWVRGEQWHEVLVRTNRHWKDCKEGSNALSDECGFVGKARALAYAKLGSIESSLEVYDEFLSRGSKSHSVFFARLLASIKSDYLCSKMAQIGLSDGNLESREELHSLNVRCLRRSGRGIEARKFLRVAMLEYPKSQPLMLEAALNHLSENKLTQGCDLLELLYNSNFSNVAVLYNWGQCLVRRVDPDAVQAVLTRGRKEWPSEKVWLILAGELARIEGHRETARQYGLEYLAGADLSDDLKSKAESLAEM